MRYLYVWFDKADMSAESGKKKFDSRLAAVWPRTRLARSASRAASVCLLIEVQPPTVRAREGLFCTHKSPFTMRPKHFTED